MSDLARSAVGHVVVEHVLGVGAAIDSCEFLVGSDADRPVGTVRIMLSRWGRKGERAKLGRWHVHKDTGRETLCGLAVPTVDADDAIPLERVLFDCYVLPEQLALSARGGPIVLALWNVDLNAERVETPVPVCRVCRHEFQ